MSNPTPPSGGSRRLPRNPFAAPEQAAKPPAPPAPDAPARPPSTPAESGIPSPSRFDGSSDRGHDEESDSAAVPGSEAPAAPPGPLRARYGQASFHVGDVEVVVARMAESDFAEPPHDPLPLRLTTRPEPPGHWAVEVAWPPWQGPGVAVFRVVAADGSPPETAADNPEATMAVTTQSSVVDSTAQNHPVSGARYYEVWVYTGPDVRTAVTTPPYLYAGGSEDATQDRVIWPPLGLEATASGKQLVLSWEMLPDQSYRMVRRTKVEARRRRPTPADCDDVGARGHVDQGVIPGQEYVYFLFAGVHSSHGTDWCPTPATKRAELPVQLEAVMDLAAEAVSDEVVNLMWQTLPVGRVEVYTSAQGPSPDIYQAGQVAFEELGQYPYNLDLSNPVRNPVHSDSDGRSRMELVDVSADSASIFFTPVTRHGRDARPGRPLQWLRAYPPSDLVLVDRVDQVLVAFRWPKGAVRVDLWRTPVDSRSPDPRTPPTASLGREDYDAFGGFLLRRDLRFSSGRCALHLAGYSQHGGSGKHSESARIEGSFPVLVEYRFGVEERRSGLRASTSRRVLQVRSAEALSAEFTLVWSPTMFPLSRGDGEPWATWTWALQARVPVTEDLPRELPDHGYVRLIADPHHEPAIAVIDPSPSQLRLPHGT